MNYNNQHSLQWFKIFFNKISSSGALREINLLLKMKLVPNQQL